jgi:hypothetical protein
VFEEPFRLVSRLRWLERETWHRRTPAVASAVMVLVLGVPLLLPMAAATDKGSLDVGRLGPIDENGRQLASSAVSRHPQGPEKNTPAVYVRNEVEYAELFLGIPVRTRLGGISELWVGDQVIAVTDRGKTFVVDRARTRLTYIDHEHRFWTTTPLPLEVDRAMCEHSLARRHEMRSSGEVAATGRSRRILEKKCAEYAVHSWSVRGDGSIDNEERFKVWATTDVPFDLSLYDDLLHNVRLIYNRDAVYRSELEEIRGLQMTLEISAGNFLTSRRITDHVVVLELRTPAPDVFAPPEGYQRRDRIEDFEM